MTDLDEITRRWTAFPSFQHLIGGGCTPGLPTESSYFPSLTPYPFSSPGEVAELRHLARCYDATQALRGDLRRAYVGETWAPPPRPVPRAKKAQPAPAQVPGAPLVEPPTLERALQARGWLDGRAAAGLPTTKQLQRSAARLERQQLVMVTQ